MRFTAAALTFSFILLLTSGCEVVRLANGKYETTMSDRGDFAAVYEDLMIIRLRNPQNETGTDDGYWEWGGKYKVREDNVIELDMDRETSRNWNFFYQLRKNGNSIRVFDHRAENNFQLIHIPAVPQKKSAPRTYPAYQ